MNHANAPTFCELLASRSADVIECETRYEQAARSLEEAELHNANQIANPPLSKKGKPLTPKLRATNSLQKSKDLRLEELLESRSSYQDVLDLKLKPWELLNILMECEDTLWTPEQAAEWDKEVANQEGRGEKGLRMRHGLPLVPTTKDVDLPELNEEIKCIEAASGKGLQPVRTGIYGQKIYGMWVMLSAEAGHFKGLTEENRVALGTGELLRSILYSGLPENVRVDVNKLLAPSVVLGRYDAVNGTTSKGFIRVPKEDADVAWNLVTVTKFGPKYELRTNYLVERLKRLT